MNEKKSSFDSTMETLNHINRVKELTVELTNKIENQISVHDSSKLEDPEKSFFDKHTRELKGLTYGSEEYKNTLAKLKPALDHHYANNSHHPEFHSNGIDGMTLMDLVEMLCDWKAATERHANGSIKKSLEHNKSRFQISAQLLSILENTVKELGWMDE